MKSLSLICLLVLALFHPLSYSQPVQLSLENGDQIAWDGAYYDFRDAQGIQMIKLWIPPGIHPVKGVLISGHGGGGGDSRNFARDENIRAFAMRLGFAVAGLHNFPGRRVYEQGAAVFFQAMEYFAALGYHPELRHLPFAMYGSSNGGAATYGFVNYAPERALCFVANVSAGSRPQIPVDAALEVPGIFIMGKFDALIGQRGIDRTRELVEYARNRGGLWSWALELKGHEDGCSFDVYVKLVEEAVRLRYPQDGDPSKGSIRLIEIREEEGWLADTKSWDSGLTLVEAYPSYRSEKSKASWLMNESMARVYQALATHHNPLEIGVREFDRTFNPYTDPGTMFSLGGPVVLPGEQLTLFCDASGFPEWEQITFYDGAEKLGEVKSGADPSLSFEVKASPWVYCLTAEAIGAGGIRRSSDPMHFFVKDPALDWNTVPAEATYSGKRSCAGSRNAGKKLAGREAKPGDSILVAYGLNAEMEAQFSSADQRLSAFWDLMGEEHDRIEMKQRSHAAEDAAFNFVLTHDCNMEVRAAYGADGMYLLLEINDDHDVAWNNAFTGTENEQFYLNFDAVDLLLDSRSLREICSPDGRELLVSRSFGLTFSTRQYQVACGTEDCRPGGFKRALADPWDFYSRFYSFDEAQRLFGIEIENVKTAPFHKAQEWFIPWTECGGGLEAEPAFGSRLAFTAGFNDRDEGEHFPPGVTSSGGSVKASNALRWIGRSDPWGSNKPPYNWGEIELGQMLR